MFPITEFIRHINPKGGEGRLQIRAAIVNARFYFSETIDRQQEDALSDFLKSVDDMIAEEFAVDALHEL
jgi:hypothetical protein